MKLTPDEENGVKAGVGCLMVMGLFVTGMAIVKLFQVWF